MPFSSWLNFPTPLFGVLQGRLDDFAWMAPPTSHHFFAIMGGKSEVVN
jgi:hypothetical protein